MDDELVAPADRLKIGKSNLRLSSIIKSNTYSSSGINMLIKLTPFYNAFEISADVPEIYMQEFWVTVSRHHSSLRFKLNGKSHTVNVDNFRDMLKICPKLLDQVFIRCQRQSHASTMEIINKCLSGKNTSLESLRLSRAQILWGMYHNKTIDYVYLLWEDLVYQVENKNSKKNNDMYYLRFTKVIVDYFMAKDQAIPRRNKIAILPQYLTNQAMLESKAYMTYHAYATGEKTLKPKSTKKKVDSESSLKTKLTQASKGKKNQDAEQVKLATKRSLIQTHSSQASGLGADEGTDDEVMKKKVMKKSMIESNDRSDGRSAGANIEEEAIT
ncbi:hypothetical protein Tco_0303064 [Tanacetum coccineum]